MSEAARYFRSGEICPVFDFAFAPVDW